MREIEFRAWCTFEEKMYEKFYIDDHMTYAFMHQLIENAQKRYKLMQYTTHTDANGIKIYEGDIIQFEFTENSCWGEPGIYTGHIRFDKGIFEIAHHRDPIRRFPDGTWTRLSEAEDMKSFMRWADEVKVIGNIYENKDLLATT